jgi:hypothetical protein
MSVITQKIKKETYICLDVLVLRKEMLDMKCN